MLLIILIACNFGLAAQDEMKHNVLIGEFVALYNVEIIYKSNEYVASEYSNYTLYSYNTATNKNTQLDVLTLNISPNLESDSIIYVKGNSIIKMSLKTKEKSTFETFSDKQQLIGVGYNEATKNLLAIILDYTTNTVNMRMYDNRKIVFFDYSFSIDPIAMEAVAPIVYGSENSLVFNCIKKLIRIDCRNLTYNYISQNCINYALGDREVIFYTFTNDSYYGFTYDLETKRLNAISNDMSQQIRSCINSYLYQSIIDNALYPTYTVCNVAYLWKDGKWNEENAPLLYESDKIKIMLPDEMNQGEPTFFWQLQ